ncbi:MAG: hypothetical protein IT370_15255 [Deltaproteobacteria bacterium]|nr:hypothetical protein [Deltaproteobacteria bacterium]
MMVAALGLALAGCKKSKRQSGAAGGAGGAGRGAGGAELSPLPALPSDTTAVLGFVRAGAAPDGAEIRAAVQALVGEDMSDPEIGVFFDACVVPISAAARRTTLVFLDRIDRERVVVVADGTGLRGAFEGCLATLGAQKSRPPEAPRQDGRLTIYAAGGDEVVAVWTGDGHVVLGISRADVEHVADVAGKPPLADAALARELGAIDTGAPVWFVAGAGASPPMASMASVRAAVKGSHADMRVLFEVDGVAQEAAEEATHELAGSMKVVAQGRELHLEGELGALLPSLSPRGKGAPPPSRPKLDDKQVRAVLASGPMMLALFLLAEGGGSEKTAVSAPVVVGAPAVASPAPPSMPAPPPPPSPPSPPGP